MNPGLPEKYKEKISLRIIICNNCKHEFPSRMRIPYCGNCHKYVYE